MQQIGIRPLISQFFEIKGLTDVSFLLVCVEDVSTDGKWCYILFWVVGKPNTRWNLLHKRLLQACPSCFSASGISYYKPEFQHKPKPPDVFLLKFWCYHDRRGLLHGSLLFSSNSC